MKDRTISVDLVREGGCLFFGKIPSCWLALLEGKWYVCVCMCVCLCVCNPAQDSPCAPVNVAEPCTARTDVCAEERHPSILCDLWNSGCQKCTETSPPSSTQTWGSGGRVCPPGLSWRGFLHSFLSWFILCLAGGAVCVGVSLVECLAVAWCHV